jgi:hypothetical protein
MAKLYYIYSEKGLMSEVKFFDSATAAWLHWLDKFGNKKDLRIGYIENGLEKYIFSYKTIKTITERLFRKTIKEEHMEVKCKYEKEFKRPESTSHFRSDIERQWVGNLYASHSFHVSEVEYEINSQSLVYLEFGRPLPYVTLKSILEKIFVRSEIKSFDSSLGKFELREFETEQLVKLTDEQLQFIRNESRKKGKKHAKV